MLENQSAYQASEKKMTAVYPLPLYSSRIRLAQAEAVPAAMGQRMPENTWYPPPDPSTNRYCQIQRCHHSRVNTKIEQ